MLSYRVPLSLFQLVVVNVVVCKHFTTLSLKRHVENKHNVLNCNLKDGDSTGDHGDLGGNFLIFLTVWLMMRTTLILHLL